MGQDHRRSIYLTWIKINDTLEGVVLGNGACGMKKVLVAVDGSDKSLEAADYAMSISCSISSNYHGL
jgi:hypothetical protein